MSGIFGLSSGLVTVLSYIFPQSTLIEQPQKKYLDFEYWYKLFLIAIFGVFIVLLIDIAISLLEGSIGKPPSPTRLTSIIISTLVYGFIVQRINNKRKRANTINELHDVLKKFREERQELFVLYDNGGAWTEDRVLTCHKLAESISEVKSRIIELGGEVAYISIDDRPTPRITFVNRVFNLIRTTGIIGILILIPLVSTFLTSASHASFVNIVATVTPTPSPTPIPTELPTSIPTPTPQPTETPTPFPSATLETESGQISQESVSLTPSFTPTLRPTTTPSFTPTPEFISASASDSAVNIRSGPAASFSIVGSLNPEDTVTVIATDSTGTWINIELGDNQTGWVSVDVVAVSDEARLTTVPVAETIPALPTSTPVPTATPTPTVAVNDPTVTSIEIVSQDSRTVTVNVSYVGADPTDTAEELVALGAVYEDYCPLPSCVSSFESSWYGDYPMRSRGIALPASSGTVSFVIAIEGSFNCSTGITTETVTLVFYTRPGPSWNINIAEEIIKRESRPLKVTWCN